jgi:hypothetical protein
VMRPPITTVANGRCTLAPVLVAIAIGIKPMLATSAVIITGRKGNASCPTKMAECRCLKPQLVAQIEYADWTDVNHLRHSNSPRDRLFDLYVEVPMQKVVGDHLRVEGEHDLRGVADAISTLRASIQTRHFPDALLQQSATLVAEKVPRAGFRSEIPVEYATRSVR